MADNTKPIPPVPNKADILEEGKDSRKTSVTWIRWFIQLRDKINLINASIANLANFSGSGFISSDGNGNFTGRTIEGTTGNIAVANGDGAAGNPKVNLVDTAVTPGTYANTNLTVDEFGRITDATNGSASGAPLTTKGDLFGYAAGDVRVPVGPDNYVLTADSSVPAGVAYKPAGTPTLPVTTKGDTLGYSTLPDRVPVGTDGQVYTADSTNPLGVGWKDPPSGISSIFAEITKSSSQSLPSGNAYIIACDTVLSDPASWYSASDTGFIVTMSGIYNFYAATSFGTNTNNYMTIYVNGVSKARGIGSPTTQFYASFSGILNLTSGDLVQWVIRSNTSCTAAFNSDDLLFRLSFVG